MIRSTEERAQFLPSIVERGGEGMQAKIRAVPFRQLPHRQGAQGERRLSPELRSSVVRWRRRGERDEDKKKGGSGREI